MLDQMLQNGKKTNVAEWKENKLLLQNGKKTNYCHSLKTVNFSISRFGG